MCVCVCVCVCVCEQTKGDVLTGSCQTQAASTISQLKIFNSKNEFGSQKQDTQTQTHHHAKTKQTPVPVYLGMHYCCTLHLVPQSIWENGEQYWDMWSLVQETSGAASVSILELCAELELSILQFTQSFQTANLNQFIQTLTKLLSCCCCLPLTTSTTPDGY